MADSVEDWSTLDHLVESLSIDSWCTLEERHLLYDLAARGGGNGAIVEIGSYKGLSTIYLASGSKRARREHVHAIDTFSGDSRPIDPSDGWFPEFRQNLRRTGVEDWVQAVINDSLGAARAWDGQPIRLLYLDADHSYEQARKDFEAWHRWVVPGGVIAFHDAIEPGWPDMSRLLDERLLDGNWILHRVVASIVYAVRQDQSLTADKLSPASFERGIFTTLREAKGSEIELRRYSRYIGRLHSGDVLTNWPTVSRWYDA